MTRNSLGNSIRVIKCWNIWKKFDNELVFKFEFKTANCTEK